MLLTRDLLHRSSSNPCLSPTGMDVLQRDHSGPIEILLRSNCFAITKQLCKEIAKAMKIGVDPILAHSGLGGAYFFRNSWGEIVAVVKPTDEAYFAPNNPRGYVDCSVQVGDTGFREVAAYLLDYNHFANVPPTVLVNITHSIFNVNDGVNGNKFSNLPPTALVKIIHSFFNVNDGVNGNKSNKKKLVTALVKFVHSIFNVNDGVNGNKSNKKKLVTKIASLQQFIPHDFDANDHGTSSFPVAAVHRIGILDIRIFNTDRHAGNILVRKLDGVGRFGQVELVPIDHGLCLPESLEDPYFEWIHWPQASIPFSEDELSYIEDLDPVRDSEMLRSGLPMIPEACLRVLVVCTIFLKEAAAFGLCLTEIAEMMSRKFRDGEKEPSELEVVCIEAKKLIVGVKPELGYLASSSTGHRSATERLPASLSFVQLADMNDEEWMLFLKKFQELMYPAFAKRKSVTLGQRQTQRLGTSCQF